MLGMRARLHAPILQLPKPTLLTRDCTDKSAQAPQASQVTTHRCSSRQAARQPGPQFQCNINEQSSARLQWGSQAHAAPAKGLTLCHTTHTRWLGVTPGAHTGAQCDKGDHMAASCQDSVALPGAWPQPHSQGHGHSHTARGMATATQPGAWPQPHSQRLTNGRHNQTTHHNPSALTIPLPSCSSCQRRTPVCSLCNSVRAMQPTATSAIHAASDSKGCRPHRTHQATCQVTRQAAVQARQQYKPSTAAGSMARI
jgi:hypothetical protein